MTRRYALIAVMGFAIVSVLKVSSTEATGYGQARKRTATISLLQMYQREIPHRFNEGRQLPPSAANKPAFSDYTNRRITRACFFKICGLQRFSERPETE
uniref:Uncharacterized protein n=1 Tax=Plectus sambesii TaxID=2011161 RepID=A0A914WQ13_9BILA